MKLSPKGVKFCPGCPSKLSLKSAPKFTVEAEKKEDTRVVTVISKHPKTVSAGLF